MDLLPMRVNCAQGVLESQESSLVPDGFLTECVNWVPEPTGGLRVRGKMKLASTTSAPATRKNVGIGTFSRYTSPQIVQQVGPVYPTPASSSTPVFALPRPTSIGNALILLISSFNVGGNTTATVTATGWTARVTLANTGTPYMNIGVYDLLNTTVSYSGSITPFTLTGVQSNWTMWLLEVAGITAFDVLNTQTSVANNSTAITATTAATAQASEFVLAFSSEVYQATGPNTGNYTTLGTSSSNWTNGPTQSSTVDPDSGASVPQITRYFYGTRTAIGTQAFTATYTVTGTLNSVLDRKLTMLAYKGWNTDAVPGTRKDLYLTANDDGTNLDIYSIPKASLVAGTWTSVDPNWTTRTDPVAFATGLGAVWYTTTTAPGIRKYDGTTPATVTGSPVGARCLAVSHERLWAGGTGANPSRLYFSQVGDGSTWSGRGTGYFDIGGDDGETIEDLGVFGGGLVVGKATSLHFLAGSNTNEFQVVPLNAGGAAPGKSVYPTPYGCVIAGREQVWLYDGESVIPIGRAIQSSYGVAAGAFVSMSYQDGSIYIADGTSTYIYVFDLNAGVWHLEKIGTLAGDAAATMFTYGDTQLYGPVNSTTSSLVGFRTFPDPDRGRDEGLPEIFRASTGDRWFAGPRNPITPRMLWVQTRQRDGDETEAGIDIDVVYDSGEAEETQFITSRIEGVYRDMLVFSDTGRGRGSVKLSFSHTADDAEDVTYDLEALAIDVERGDAR